MLMKFEDASDLIKNGKLLHIAGTEELLRKLPKGKWIGGSTEYFMSKEGGMVSGEMLFVTEFPYENHKVVSYGSSEVKNVATDAYAGGFSVLIVPFDSMVHREYAEKAADFMEIFLKPVVGWISGMNLSKSGQIPIALNGATGEVFLDKAVCLHMELPEGKTASINIVNIFEEEENTPILTFTDEGFTVEKCFVGDEEVIFAEYLEKNNIDVKLPIIGSYSGVGINVSFRTIENGVVKFYAPVFNGIEYRFAKKIPDYMEAFQSRIEALDVSNLAFSCNCILNFLYGGLENKKIETFEGPITFGEIAYQLVNQTLVYVTVE